MSTYGVITPQWINDTGMVVMFHDLKLGSSFPVNDVLVMVCSVELIQWFVLCATLGWRCALIYSKSISLCKSYYV